MSTVRELRVYVARPGRIDELVERWQTHYRAIFADHMTVLGLFASQPERADLPTGVALLLEHDDRAGAERTFLAAKADPRMEQAPGPTGEELVDRWERTFLYPLN